MLDLYYEIMKEHLPWDKYKEPLAEKQTVERIEELCDEYDVPSELVRNMLLSVYTTKNYSNPKIMRKSLEKV